MKAHILFAGSLYDALGGLDDFQGHFDTFEEAREAGLSYCRDRSYSWAHVWTYAKPDEFLHIHCYLDERTRKTVVKETMEKTLE